MDLFKAAEMGKVNLDQEITLQESWLDNAYGDLYKKGAGYKLTIREAIKIMLQDSDNTALKAVAASTPPDFPIEDRSFSAVDVDFQQNQDMTVSISARSYSSFLKCLYYSCYTNHDDSQEILSYLTESSFDNRLVAGVSNKDIKVAHKIGVNSENTQSDCGIVYMQRRNYLLCVMIKGQNNETTDKHIAEMSKLVYEYLDKTD